MSARAAARVELRRAFGDDVGMNIARAVVLGGIVAVAGCHGDSGQSSAGSRSNPAKKHAAVHRPMSADEQTADMVEAATVGKSTAPVELKFSLGRPPAVGQVQAVSLALIVNIPADSATVQIADSSSGLAIADADRQYAIQNPVPGTVYRHDFTVTPTADGLGIVPLTVELHHDEISETKKFALPLIVGDDRAASRTAAAPK